MHFSKCRAIIITFQFGAHNTSEYGGLAQLVRAPASHAGGLGFESLILHHTVRTRTREGSGIFLFAGDSENVEMHEQSLKDDILSEQHDSKPVLVIFTLPEYNGCNSKSLCEGKVISNVTVEEALKFIVSVLHGGH